jgi:hypothetical protein
MSTIVKLIEQILKQQSWRENLLEIIDLYWWRIKFIIQYLKNYKQKERIFDILQRRKIDTRFEGFGSLNI